MLNVDSNMVQETRHVCIYAGIMGTIDSERISEIFWNN